LRFGVTVAAAVLAYMAVGAAGLSMLLAAWPGYAEATTAKGYSLAMLLGRLAVAVLSAALAGVAAGRISGIHAAWTAGALLAAASGWIHVTHVWPDYPVWYHAAYVLPIAPVAAAGAWMSGRRPQPRT
jgi:hypothetical protein